MTRRLPAALAALCAACVLLPYKAGAAAVPAAPAIAPWYDTHWTRRDAITVEGSPAGAQTNYPVKLTILYDAAMKADFSDLRFTDSSGTVLLSYWVESATNSTSALVWVKVPSVPIAPDTVVFYVYYGNPAALSMSNGDATFTLFDTFGTGGTPGDWNYTNNVIGEHAIIRNGKLYAPLYDSDHGVNGGLVVINPINGTVIKHFSIPGFCTAAAPAFDKNGFLHIYDCGGFITKVDENNGTVLRSRSIGGALDWEAVPYDPVNDILLIASKEDHSLSAIRASDYSLVWRNTDVDLTYGSSEIAPPLIVGAYVYWQDYSAKLYKISLSTGITAASTFATTAGFPATPYSFSSYSQIIYDSVNNRLYLTNSTGHTAFAINPADLSVAWSKVVESDGWNFNRGGAWHNNVWYVTTRHEYSKQWKCPLDEYHRLRQWSRSIFDFGR
jgi:DNA-binding beta-propeller fold protein YncE